MAIDINKLTIFGYSFSLPLLAKCFINNSLIIAWLLALGVCGFLAATGSFSDLLFRIKKEIDTKSTCNGNGSTNMPNKSGKSSNTFYPTQILNEYLLINYTCNLDTSMKPPPLEILLDKFLDKPSWRVIDNYVSLNEVRNKNEVRNNDVAKQAYTSLFKTLEGRLIAIAKDSSKQPKLVKLKYDLVHSYFKDQLIAKNIAKNIVNNDEINQKVEEKIDLPIEATNWILAERNRLEKEENRLNLVDTFFLVIVLGAFGSLVLLMNKSIKGNNHLSLRLCFYGPILGSFLASAVFITDVSLHSLISTSDFQNLRRESLFVLALGAGLLSEETYIILVKRIKKAIKDSDDSNHDKSNVSDSSTSPL